MVSLWQRTMTNERGGIIKGHVLFFYLFSLINYLIKIVDRNDNLGDSFMNSNQFTHLLYFFTFFLNKSSQIWKSIDPNELAIEHKKKVIFSHVDDPLQTAFVNLYFSLLFVNVFFYLFFFLIYQPLAFAILILYTLCVLIRLCLIWNELQVWNHVGRCWWWRHGERASSQWESPELTSLEQ